MHPFVESIAVRAGLMGDDMVQPPLRALLADSVHLMA
jgi:hypothetical protein